MSNTFDFKQFSVAQNINSQKVGTDSMLLGAWTSGKYSRILDIGTGTGILSLMLAQKNPEAIITAIEPDLPSLQEAEQNFRNSPFPSRIHPIHTTLQSFGSIEKYDLIIANPPYFNGTYLSENSLKNAARHQVNLTIFELYENSAELLAPEGNMAVVVPYELEDEHIHYALHEGLYVQQLTRTLKEDNSFKRSLLLFSLEEKVVQYSEMIVKNKLNQYSPEYVALTAEFYKKNLSSY